MKIIEQSWEWIQKPVLPLEIIEKAGRTCYKSENKITSDSAEEFTKMILNRGHESVIEHVSASVKFITNRGVTHQLVRHSFCNFSQESTRYVKYGKNMEFIKPVWFNSATELQKSIWKNAMHQAQKAYAKLIEYGWRPEQAREVLPNSLKTEIVVTTNLREWRHIFRSRCAKSAHPQMRYLMLSCLCGFGKEIPILFG